MIISETGANVTTASLFAQKLRAWRGSAGLHGRMTQESLAERLGVSVDAIGKYERSASFIRGDLEHRLVDRLGWSRDEVLACREDWSLRQHGAGPGVYSVLDQAGLDRIFGGSLRAAIEAGLAVADAEFGDLPADFAPDPDRFVPLYEATTGQWAIALKNDEIVAKWFLPFLLPEDEARFRDRTFLENALGVDRLRRPIFPGRYFGYCPALIVRSGHEAVAPLLVSSFVAALEALARRDVVLSAIGTVSVSPGGAQLCRDLGMTHLGQHQRFDDYGCWVLEGADIATSLFGRKSPVLRRHYSAAFAE
ncbi:MAG: helix-turn-helix domain-containing protein [Boseongicola sp.]|nr:helix-turn-helix domain-containing protein [Boseongicola sp.]NNJ69316.1 helix-turn-helix transcriptional regulator [Boseongicola sp.]